MEPKKKSLLWVRITCLVVTAGAMFLVFRRIDIGALLEALSHMRVAWFLAALALYGFLFLPASWRWHLALRLTGSSVHVGASTRLSLIGHFLYTIFFGAAGGDVAKSALYARWYRWSLPEVLAASSLDRLLGFGGLVSFACLGLAVALAHGGFTGLALPSVRWPGRWLLLAGAAVVLLLFVLRRSRGESPISRFTRVFLDGGRRLVTSPPTLLPGLCCALLVQVSLSGTLALNLVAVNPSHVEWTRLVWVFPVISIVSALPITLAGLGVREGAVLVLLGLYGISGADAVAASLLTVCVSFIWAGAGGILLWRESGRQRQRPIPQTISVVMPVLNDEDSIASTIQCIQKIPEIREILVVDGGSSDGTCETAANLGCRVMVSPPGRGSQMRRGAEQSSGDVVLLLDADAWLPPVAGRAVVNALRDSCVVGGGFWRTFGRANPLLIGSRLRCALRLCVGRRIAGDQAIFVRRDVLESVGGVPDVPLMEDYELCGRLRKVGRLALADATIVTSARRQEREGAARACLRWLRVAQRCRPGASAGELWRSREKE